MPEHLINTFSQGEISPQWYGRMDLEQYMQAARRVVNFMVLPSGAVQKRPGTYFVGNTKRSGESSNTQVRLVAFQISATEGYVLEFGHQYIRFYTNSGVVESGGSPYEVATTYTAATLAGLKFTQIKNSLYIVSRGYPIRRLTYTSATSWAIADLSLTVTASWLQDLSSADERPGAVTVYDQRLFVAGTNEEPGTIWGSKVGTFGNFDISSPLEPEDSVEYSPLSMERLDIRWIIGAGYLLLGTTDGLWSGFGPTAAPSGEGGASTFFGRRQSSVGSSDVQGLMVNDYVFFVERGGKKIRQARFQEQVESFITPAVSVSVQHYFDQTPVTEMHFQLSPDPTLWVVRESGGPCAFSYSEETGSAGWSEIDMGGDVVSMAVLRDDTGEDKVWAVVNRTINGAAETTIERFAAQRFFDTADCHYVDCGLDLDYGTATVQGVISPSGAEVEITANGHGFSNGDSVKFVGVTGATELNGNIYTIQAVTTNTFELVGTDGDNFSTFTGTGTVERVVDSVTVSHLDGETVAIWADGAVVSDKPVVSNVVDLGRYMNRIHVGLPFSAKINTLPPPGGQTKLKQPFNSVIRFTSTIGGKIGNREDDLTIIKFLNTGFTMDEGPAFFDGVKQTNFRSKPSYDGSVWIVSDQPSPMTILNVGIEMRVEEEMQ